MSIDGARPGPAMLRRAALLLPVAAAIVLFFALRLDRYATAAALAEHRAALAHAVDALGVAAPLLFAFFYAALVAASIPGASFLTIAAGFLFGTLEGAVVSLAGATTGAIGIFLLARGALGAPLARRAGPLARRLAAAFERNAFSYLLFLRLVPIFPFCLVNLVPAFLGVRLSTFAAATLIGIVPGSLVYAGLGAALARVIAEGGSADAAQIGADPQVWLPLAGLGILSLLPALLRRRTKEQP